MDSSKLSFRYGRRGTLAVILIVSLGCIPQPARAENRGAPRQEDSSSWEPIGLSGGGGMFAPAISPADPDLMMLNCDMSGAYISEDGGHHWRMIHHAQLRSDTRCQPGFHPTNPDVIYASSRGQLRISRDRGRTFVPIGDLKESLYGQIAINPSDPAMMLVGTRHGLCWRSADGGVPGAGGLYSVPFEVRGAQGAVA